MLINANLYNPVEMDGVLPDEMFQKYIDIRDRQPKLMPTAPEVITEVRNRFFGSHPEVDRGQLGKVWEPVRSMVQENEALASFILDNKGAESEFFFPWLANIRISPSLALEMSYGEGTNVRGEWRKAGVDDPIDLFVKNDPTFVYNRERQFKVADLVTTDRNRMRTGEKSRVLDLGAGRMAWARHHGFRFKPRLQEIIACDKDPTISPETLFAGIPESIIGLAYKKVDIAEMLCAPICRDVSLALLLGVASYYPLDKFKGCFVGPIYLSLRKGGSFFFDLQLDCLYYRRSMKVFSWPPMRLMASATEAIEALENMRASLWEKGIRFSAEYALDTYNKFPTSVMVLLTKI